MKLEIKLLKHQLEFVKDTKHKILALIGGYGSGKTIALSHKVINGMFTNPGTDIMVVAPTYSMLSQIILPDLERILQEYHIRYEYKKGEGIFYCRINNKTNRLILKSGDDPSKLVGFSLSMAIVDEIDTMKKDKALEIYEKLLGRLRTGTIRQLCFTSTPEGYEALYDIFVSNFSKEKRIIKAKSTDNFYLPDDFIETLRKQYPENLLKAYINGDFVNLANETVYNYFNRSQTENCSVLHQECKDGREIHVGQDFNIGGCASIISTNTPIPVILDAIAPRDTFEVIKYLKSTYPKSRIIIFPDASGRSSSTNASKSDIQLFLDAGFEVHAKKANPRIQDRINTLNLMFQNKEIIISTEAEELIKALEQQSYDDQGRPQKYSGSKTVDDFNDALGYLIHYQFNKQQNTQTMVSTRRFG